MMSIEDLAKAVSKSADKIFPDRTDTSMFMKLFSEIGELVEGQNEEEFADVMIMLLDYGYRKKFKLTASILTKMRRNESRTWTKNSLGVMKHVG